MAEASESLNQKNNPPVPFLVRCLATGFFSGYSPVASGTAGSLVGLAMFLIPAMQATTVLAAAIVVMFFIGTYVSARMEQAFGDDPSIVVIDEVVGMWISLLLLPVSIWICVLAFVLFRVFDIFKPPPARRIEKLRNGWGIMLDDVIAGLYANLAVRLMIVAFPNLL